MTAKYFATPAAFRSWLEKNSATKTELWVGYHRRRTGTPSITWPESVDEALCFGWIDGIRKTVDEDRYMIRFTPRKPKSNWSTVNIKRVAELTKLGLMKEAGLKVFNEREAKREYSYEQTRATELAPEYAKEFRTNRKAWTFFEAQAPSYQRTLKFWVMNARKEETQRARLKKLIDTSAAGKRVT